LLALLSFLLYWRTLAPNVFVSDFAEFQTLPAVLGLPHPNGFPLYMLLGWAWAHLPWGNLAWRMNLLSAVTGALAVGVTAAFAHRLSGRRSVAWLAGGLLALTPTFWGYSLLAERYSLNTALVAGVLWLAWEATCVPSSPRTLRLMIASSALLGLGLDVHPSDALLIPFWLAYLTVQVPRMRHDLRPWLLMALAGAAPLALYLYVPWRWAAYASWPLLPGIGRSAAVYRGLVHVWYEPPLRWDLVWYYITGLGGYATGLLGGGWRDAFTLLGAVWPYWRAEIAWPLALLALVGAMRLWRRERVLMTILAAFIVFLTLMVAYIQQGKNDAYLLPAFWIVLFAAGFAADWIPARPASRWERGARLLGQGLILLLLLILLLVRYPRRDLSRHLDIHDWWTLTLAEPIEKGAALLGHWSDLTPLWYMQQAEGVRPDLWGLFPPDIDKIIQPWLDTGTPLYMAAPTHGWAPELPRRYHLIPWGHLVRVLPRGAHVSCFNTLGQTPNMRTSWFRLGSPIWPHTLNPLLPGAMLFCWRAERPLPRDTFVALKLQPVWGGPPVDVTGAMVSPWYPLPRVPAGEEGLTLLSLSLPEGTPPGTYRASLRFFRILADGRTQPLPRPNTLSLGEVTVAPTRTFVRARLRDEVAPPIVPQAGPLLLRAWRLSHLPVRPGDPVRLDLIWEVREQPTAPLRLQVRFWGRGGRGLVTSPQPLLPGAPASVWKPGTIVRTVHSLRAPRGLGDHVYLVEVRLMVGNRRARWFPTDRWWVGITRVHDRPHLWSPPQGVIPVSARFGDVAELVGYRVERNQGLKVTLVWRALGEVGTSYKVFLHLVGPKGTIVGQHDSVPALGTLPTDVWVPGEFIVDEHSLALPKDMGGYVLRVGLYNPATGARVPVLSATRPVQDNSVILEP